MAGRSSSKRPSRPNPPAAGGIGHKRHRASTQRHDASPYAELAGQAKDPHWWRGPAISLVLVICAVTGAAVVGGVAGTVLLVLGAAAGLPAFLAGLFLIFSAAIHKSDPQVDARRRQAAQRILTAALVVSVLLATAGVVIYASDPGVASYQASLLLVLPLFAVVLRFVHRRIPARIEWALAIVLALIGCGGYLVAGGAQWWNWGQFAVYPLAILIVVQGAARAGPSPRSTWYGGSADGPWGPP